MAVFKCKMCGGALEIAEGATVAECAFCGTKQTVPRLTDEKRANLYDRANHFRRIGDYDKAMALYEQILAEDATDAEAYWSIVLCRYGIEYVEDPTTHKRVPTVHRAQYTSILADEDYLSALSHADGYQRDVLESEAKEIDRLQKEILAISKKEKPFDVFICYKETGDDGERTKDSVLAQDLYFALTNEGLKVFFARITLEDKLGSAYEPYIFAALNSAKVMVVLGTKPEHFKAVWVKNEWSRYLSLMREGAQKTLIPAYRDMDPYDLPDDFSHLQALDMSKLGFMQDLIRGVKKILGKDNKTATPVTEKVIISNEGHDIAPLLRRAFLFLEDGAFKNADEYAEKVLDINPECAEAYVVKLLVELGLKKPSDLAQCKSPISESGNYQKAIRFATPEYRATVESYNNAIVERQETDRMEGLYARGVELISQHRYDDAIQYFQKILTYKDSAQKIELCKEKKENARKDAIYSQAIQRVALKNANDIAMKKSIAELQTISGFRDADDQVIQLQVRLEKWYQAKRAEEEKARIRAEEERLARQRAAELKRAREEQAKKRIKRIARIGLPSLAVLAIVLVLIFTLIVPAVKFNHADALMDAGKYEEAMEIYQGICNFSKSAQRITVLEGIDSIYNAKYEIGISTILSAGVPVKLTYGMGGGDFSGNTYLSAPQDDTNGSIMLLSTSSTILGAPLATTASTPDTIEYTYNSSADFTGIQTPGRSGYRFVKWELGTYKYQTDEMFEIRLNAVWSEKEYTIEYDFDGGTDSENNPIEYGIEDSFTLVDPTKTGYTFIGWTGADLDGLTMSVTIDRGSIGNRCYKANWKANQYTLTFDPNGGTCETKNMTVTYDEPYTLPIPEKTGYTFGWYSGNTRYSDGIWKTPDEVTLVARWTAESNIPYTVKHYLQNINDDSFSLDSNATQHLTGVADSRITPSVKSYAGFTSPKARTVTVAPDGTLVVEYYYTRNLYTITMVVNGGEELVSITQKYQSALTMPVAVRDGYTFGGWFSDSVLNTEFTDTVIPAKNTTVYAWWTEENKPTDFTYSGATGITVSAYKGTSTTMWIPAYISGIPVIKISSSAFQYQTSITNAVVPTTITSIGYAAFAGCSGLESLTLPFVGGSVKSATDTYQYPFGYIFGTFSYTGGVATKQYYHGSSTSNTTYDTYYIPESLKSVTITGENILYGAFDQCRNLTNITILNSVTSIGSSAFRGCTGLTSIIIPDSVTSIGGWAFSGCTGLTSITIPNSVTSIGSSAFDNTAYYNTDSNWDNGVLYIGYHLIKAKTTLSGAYQIKEGTLTVAGSAFDGCTGLTSVTIPDSVTSIGDSAFSGCTGMTSVTIGNGVTSIGDRAFSGCTGLTAVHITDLAAWCGIAFSDYSSNPLYYAHHLYLNGEKITNLVIPNSVTSIGDRAFYGCTGLTSITIPDSVTSIGDWAFYGCTGLTSITIPDSVTSIGDDAFYGCTGLTSITVNTGNSKYHSDGNCLIETASRTLILGCQNSVIPLDGSVTSIGDRAFYGCTGLTSITIPNSVTRIGDRAFYGCTGLTSITVNTGNLKYHSNGNCLIETDSKTLILGCQNSVIPSDGSVTSIGERAFYGCTGLTSITIPNSVKSIGWYAFYGCTGLTSITIPNSVKSIGWYAFYGCTRLTSVTFANTSGWYRTTDSTATSGPSMDVTNASTNATNLVSSYYSYYWKRS